MGSIIFLVIIVLIGASMIINHINWTIATPVILLPIVLYILYRIHSNKKRNDLEGEYLLNRINQDNFLIENAPVKGQFKCSQCGAFTKIDLSDKEYKCSFCGARLNEAYEESAKLIEEKKRQKSIEIEEKDKDREIRLKELEIEKAKLDIKAESNKSRGKVMQIVFPILALILLILFFALGIHGTIGALFDTIFNLKK